MKVKKIVIAAILCGCALAFMVSAGKTVRQTPENPSTQTDAGKDLSAAQAETVQEPEKREQKKKEQEKREQEKREQEEENQDVTPTAGMPQSNAVQEAAPPESVPAREAKTPARAAVQDAEAEAARPKSAEPQEEQDTEPSGEPDTEPPVIKGAKDLAAEVGGSVSYKQGVTVEDNSGEKIVLKIDNSQADLNVPGVYEVIYCAADSAGNRAETRVTLTVTAPAPLNRETVDALADQVIAENITADMSQYDMAWTLWRWCRYNIIYSYTATVRTELEGAYEGLHDRKGDCYIYYATYKLLLTKCGIKNMCVARVGGSSNHWWNLVDVGNGWYHCDSSPRYTTDNFFVCFMQTDEQIAQYSAYYESKHPGHPNYYGFDASLCPDRGTAVLLENIFPQ